MVHSKPMACQLLKQSSWGRQMSVAKNDALKVRIFPNPANQKVNIKLGEYQNATIQFMNIHGQTMIEKFLDVSSASIDISDLPNGMYLVELILEDSRVIKRLIKN